MNSAQTNLTDTASDQAKADAFKETFGNFTILMPKQVDCLCAHGHLLQGSDRTLLSTILAFGGAMLGEKPKVVEEALQPALFDLTYSFNTDLSMILAQLIHAVMLKYYSKSFVVPLQRAGMLLEALE